MGKVSANPGVEMVLNKLTSSRNVSIPAHVGFKSLDYKVAIVSVRVESLTITLKNMEKSLNFLKIAFTALK